MHLVANACRKCETKHGNAPIRRTRRRPDHGNRTRDRAGQENQEKRHSGCAGSIGAAGFLPGSSSMLFMVPHHIYIDSRVSRCLCATRALLAVSSSINTPFQRFPKSDEIASAHLGGKPAKVATASRRGMRMHGTIRKSEKGKKKKKERAEAWRSVSSAQHGYSAASRADIINPPSAYTKQTCTLERSHW